MYLYKVSFFRFCVHSIWNLLIISNLKYDIVLMQLEEMCRNERKKTLFWKSTLKSFHPVVIKWTMTQIISFLYNGALQVSTLSLIIIFHTLFVVLLSLLTDFKNHFCLKFWAIQRKFSDFHKSLFHIFTSSCIRTKNFFLWYLF